MTTLLTELSEMIEPFFYIAVTIAFIVVIVKYTE